MQALDPQTAAAAFFSPLYAPGMLALQTIAGGDKPTTLSFLVGVPVSVGTLGLVYYLGGRKAAAAYTVLAYAGYGVHAWMSKSTEEESARAIELAQDHMLGQVRERNSQLSAPAVVDSYTWTVTPQGEKWKVVAEKPRHTAEYLVDTNNESVTKIADVQTSRSNPGPLPLVLIGLAATGLAVVGTPYLKKRGLL